MKVPEPANGPVVPANRPQTVLVVDDDPDILDSLRALLEGSIAGVRVVPAASGSEALAAMRKQPVDLIVTDYKMPGMDGLQFLDEARRLAPNVPRILITAYPDLDLAIKAINDARIENFSTKPLDPEGLVEVVQAALYERRAAEMRGRAFARSLDALRRRVQPLP